MSVSGIEGQLLEVTVVGCNKLKDTGWISSQDPYVCLEYGSTKYRTRTCTDGGKNPTFQQKFVFTLIEGLREFNVVVWNSNNTLTYDDLIGSGKIQLHRVLSQGYDDTRWPLQNKKGRHAGEIQLILHYANANANKPTKIHTPSAPSAPSYSGALAPQVPLYSSTPSFTSNYPPTSYSAAPPPLYSSYPPHSSGYPPPPYNHQQAAYPPTYSPPPSQDTHYYPPGPYPPHPYPPPPY